MAIAIAMPTHADILSVPSSQTVENPDQAENPDSLTDVFMLDQFVVTSSKSEVKRRESPSLVNVMTGKLLTLSRRVFTCRRSRFSTWSEGRE